MTVSVFAPAKINLTLHVTGQAANGYHLLDSYVVFPQIGDEIHVSAGRTLALTVTGAHAASVSADRDNLVMRAARLLDPNGRAGIDLHKQLPVSAGIGGGSADAAATLHALEKLWDRSALSVSDMMKLGADVPVCYGAGNLRMQGTGEHLTPLQNMPRGLGILLVNPGVKVATPDVFNALETRSNPPMPDEVPNFTRAAEMCNWLKTQRNDLENAAVKIAPVIQSVLMEIEKTNCLIARMSGSGATCFGLYETLNHAKAALRSIQQDHAGWWVVSSGFAQVPDPPATGPG